MKLHGFLVLFFLCTCCYSQIPMDKDSIQKIITSLPAFSIYKDNYFVTGVRLGETPSRNNMDAKFQFSFKQRLSNKPEILGAYPYLTYTQKSFWKIYKASSPFEESNYNPGLMLLKPIFKNNSFHGVLSYGIEHESNGRDSIYSRSFNAVSIGFTRIYSQKLFITIKAWIPFLIDNNPSLPRYIGYAEGQLQWISLRDRLFFDVTIRKGADWDFKGSFNAAISYKLTKKANQLITLQWWQGYSESLIDFKSEQGMLRIGFIIKPTFYRFY
ncbi:phospholipase A [Flavobacterium pectinovorum]|uniref:phospholipase A n=1 Tax=Flavobacterium pectinovorum TaxID=29533 RepID=UPI001FAD2BD5|nr:phospholipase A [Flavobacterium pectinovorum]MCI9845520.1 phospholipase A [Flavobacterium pectinovorum]